MKKKNGGFTIVELVIVIAVIAILAAVLIPTFSNVVEKANASAALSNAKNALTMALADQTDASLADGTVIIVNSKYVFEYNGSQLSQKVLTTDYTLSCGYTAGKAAVDAHCGGTDGKSTCTEHTTQAAAEGASPAHTWVAATSKQDKVVTYYTYSSYVANTQVVIKVADYADLDAAVKTNYAELTADIEVAH